MPTDDQSTILLSMLDLKFGHTRAALPEDQRLFVETIFHLGDTRERLTLTISLVALAISLGPDKVGTLFNLLTDMVNFVKDFNEVGRAVQQEKGDDHA